MSNSWKTISSKVIYKNKFISLYKNKVFPPNNKLTEYPIVERKAAVVVVPIESDRTTYLVKQYRYTLNKVSIEFPAGYINEGETPLAAAQRELAEEVGLKGKTWKEISHVFMMGSLIKAKHIYFVAKNLTKTIAAPDPTENIAIMKLPLNDVVKMVMDQKIDIGSSVLAILLTDILLKEGKL